MSTITYGTEPLPVSTFYLSSDIATGGHVDLEDAEKIVVDNTVHIDGDHNDHAHKQRSGRFSGLEHCAEPYRALSNCAQWGAAP